MKRFFNRISARKFWILIGKTYVITFLLFSFGDDFNPFIMAVLSTLLFSCIMLLVMYEQYLKDPYIGIKNRRRFLRKT